MSKRDPRSKRRRHLRRPSRLAGTAVLTAILAVTLTLVPGASARRAPTRREARAISHALHASPATKAVKCFHVRQIVISTAGPWARATLAACNPQKADNALTVLQRSHGRWHVRDIGTSGVGCTVAPRRVRHDLRLDCR